MLFSMLNWCYHCARPSTNIIVLLPWQNQSSVVLHDIVQYMYCILLTTGDDLVDCGVEFTSHEAHEAEDDEASEDAGGAVTNGNDQCIPGSNITCEVSSAIIIQCNLSPFTDFYFFGGEWFSFRHPWSIENMNYPSVFILAVHVLCNALCHSNKYHYVFWYCQVDCRTTSPTCNFNNEPQAVVVETVVAGEGDKTSPAVG